MLLLLFMRGSKRNGNGPVRAVTAQREMMRTEVCFATHAVLNDVHILRFQYADYFSSRLYPPVSIRDMRLSDYRTTHLSTNQPFGIDLEVGTYGSKPGYRMFGVCHLEHPKHKVHQGVVPCR